MASDFIQMDLLAWGGIHLEQQEPEQYPFDQPEEFTDGITPDRVETIELELPKNIKDTVSISMSRGDSGKWYCGWSARCAANKEGTGHAAYPKFSATFDSRYEAFDEAMNQALAWLVTRKVSMETCKTIKAALMVHLQKIDPIQYERDTTCDEWRTCGYAEQCFSQPLDCDPGPVCYKDQYTARGGLVHQQSLAELCSACHAATNCEKCCATCANPCNAKQRCRWPE